MSGGDAVEKLGESSADKRLLLEVESIDLEGRGVARLDGRVIFVDDGLPGERVVAQTVKRRGRYDRAHTLEILHASSSRVTPACPSYGICGGCSMQHIDSATQLAVKQRVLEDQLWHLARIRPDHMLAPIMGSAWNYRRRARLSVRHVVRKGKVLVGFHERSSRYVADMLECHVLSRRMSALLPVLRELVATLSIRDRIPQIEVSEGDAHCGAQGILQTPGPVTAQAQWHWEAQSKGQPVTQFEGQPEAQSVGQSERRVDGWRSAQPTGEHRANDSVLALVFRVLEPPSETDRATLHNFAERQSLELWLQPKGPDSIELLYPKRSGLAYMLNDFGLRMDYLPTDFTQVNPPINARMVWRAIRLLDLQPGDRVLDLFCGLGNFSLPLARVSREVLGVELSAALTRRAQDLARRHGLGSSARFAAANLFEITTPQWEALGKFSKALVDPPREGAQRVCEHFARQKTAPAQIVYVSCNPATLARDAAILVHQGPYQLRSAGVVNMFPQTSHVESMAVFTRRI
jgi:23S rRNA (uracil1939-C5)-methyltransferase